MIGREIVTIFIVLNVLKVQSDLIEEYHELPKFWNNVGLCPAGSINQKDISSSLNSDAMEMNLLQISSLPVGAIQYIRIHWLLEMLKFEKFTQNGIPIYDFVDLDKFMEKMDKYHLNPVIEFMANPGNVFGKNPLQNYLYWEDLVIQVVKHYLNMYGATKVLKWKFESWNEPDLAQYNILNLSMEDYLNYSNAIQNGLKKVGKRPEKSLEFRLRGPAGLFKNEDKHRLCWGILDYCNQNLTLCPFDTFTFHRKGNGKADDVLINSIELLNKIFKLYPNLKNSSFSNDEADLISGWSTSREENADVRYANSLIRIVMQHWDAKLRNKHFQYFESLSHDNAFLSYHPYEFQQRTLLAHFQMNNSYPQYSQFIQKPVYAALGLLAKLGPISQATIILNTSLPYEVRRMQTFSHPLDHLYVHIIDISTEIEMELSSNYTFSWKLPYNYYNGIENNIGYIGEVLAQNLTDPYCIWKTYNQPAFPNASLRHLMRLAQGPKIVSIGEMEKSDVKLHFYGLQTPWILSFRICSKLKDKLKAPQYLETTEITKGEVFLSWREVLNSTDCLKTYEVWFQAENQYWINISLGQHIPFPSFHFAPLNEIVNGFYKVRGIDIFNRTAPFSNIIEYYQL